MAYMENFLSDNARALISIPYLASHSGKDYHGDFLIDFETLPDAVVTPLSRCQFSEALSEVSPLILSSTASFATFTTVDLARSQFHLFEWLSDPVEFLELHTRLSRENVVEKVLLLQRLTALIEGSLSGLHWTLNPKCPNTMKDLLMSLTLENMCGKKCLLLFRLFFGPVNSMNLRNLIWHGFISPSVARHCNASLLPFIFVLILSLGKRLACQTLPGERKPSRISSLCSLSIEHFPWLCDSGQQLTKATHSHPVSSCPSVEYFSHLDILFDGPEPRYLDALCLSFICLSILLRCEFAAAVGVPELCQSAEHRFFLTLDSILEFKTDTVLGRPVTQDQFSQFSARCGDLRGLAVLLDVLCSENGPRLKDRVSHGEFFIRRYPVIHQTALTWDGIDDRFKCSAILMRACLLALLSAQTLASPRVCELPTDWLSSYQLEFHPTAQFARNWLHLANRLSEFNDHPEILYSEIFDYDNFESLTEQWFPNQTYDVKGPSLPYLMTNLWELAGSWSFSASDRPSVWSSKPAALLVRLNQLLILYTLISDSLRDILVKLTIAGASELVSSRKYATFERMRSTFPAIHNLLTFVHKFSACAWHCWIDGSLMGSSRIEVRQRYSTDLKSRAKLIDCLQRTGEKLTMWIGKSKWELIMPFLESVKYPVPHISSLL
ncbi:hypothetical protein CRM22_004475 [Opisthorchis felineus]|uniref:DUF4209 domain-containing protein n=1 Tax=Opisthorchis felineus TaxID=147828 RepID=A0A4S2LVZ0_OPIFE|nr:hypothetical protein CRM22_004475 [Opisthorchis felineus]